MSVPMLEFLLRFFHTNIFTRSIQQYLRIIHVLVGTWCAWFDLEKEKKYNHNLVRKIHSDQNVLESSRYRISFETFLACDQHCI